MAYESLWKGFRRLKACAVQRVRTWAREGKAGFSHGSLGVTTDPRVSLGRFLKLFELPFPHLKNEAYETELPELLGGTERSRCVGKGSSDCCLTLRPQSTVIRDADPPDFKSQLSCVTEGLWTSFSLSPKLCFFL